MNRALYVLLFAVLGSGYNLFSMEQFLEDSTKVVGAAVLSRHDLFIMNLQRAKYIMWVKQTPEGQRYLREKQEQRATEAAEYKKQPTNKKPQVLKRVDNSQTFKTTPLKKVITKENNQNKIGSPIKKNNPIGRYRDSLPSGLHKVNNVRVPRETIIIEKKIPQRVNRF